jgi:phosphoesterase RecJ-like protein
MVIDLDLKFLIFALCFFWPQMRDIHLFKKHIAQPLKMVILTHFNPDADALGSSIGLSRYLTKKGHSVVVIAPSDYPDFIGWMPAQDEVTIFKKEKSDRIAQVIREPVRFLP